MKKIFTLALMAMMAVSTVMTTSCTKDDDPVAPVNPDKYETVKFDANLNIEAQQASQESTAASELARIYQGAVGNGGTVTAITVDGQVALQFKTTKASEAAFKNDLQNVDASDIDAIMNHITGVTVVNLSVTTGNEAVIKYNYSHTASIVTGNWSATIDGVNYGIELTSTKSYGTAFDGTLSIDGKKISGIFRTDGKHFHFDSDEKATDGSSKYVASFTTDGTDMRHMKVTVMDGSKCLLQNATLNK